MTNNRLKELRKNMQSSNIDAIIIPTADYHMSEMVGEFFKTREYITGFTGSAGTAVITADDAGLWTDGRYYIQAEMQLAGSGIKLYKLGDGLPGGVRPRNPGGVRPLGPLEWLTMHLQPGMRVGFDGRTMPASMGLNYETVLAEYGIETYGSCNIIDDMWKNRPAISKNPAFYLEEKYSGEKASFKLSRVRQIMDNVGADVHIITSLDDIAWLLNIRGGDIECSPLLLAYAIVYNNHVDLFTDKRKLDSYIKDKLKENNVHIYPYEDIYRACSSLRDCSILLDSHVVNYRLYCGIDESCTVIDDDNPSSLMKTIKNKTELANIKFSHIKDGIAVTKFMYWIKNVAESNVITELDAANKIHSLRAEQKGFIEDSFEPIIAYGEHGAIIHYSATEESNTVIKPGNLLLTDTGGHYMDGTTDISRTLVIGDVPLELKHSFTAVARANINLARAKFAHGSHGYNLDAIARQPIWEMNKDYRHGTGHGVGYLTNVHEGPIAFRQKAVAGDQALEEGMVITNEPGIYEEGRYGIRTENELIVRCDTSNDSGEYMQFETVTLAPIDLDGIIKEDMQADEIEWLNAYHRRVYEEISPHLTPEEAGWLREYTRALNN